MFNWKRDGTWSAMFSALQTLLFVSCHVVLSLQRKIGEIQPDAGEYPDVGNGEMYVFAGDPFGLDCRLTNGSGQLYFTHRSSVLENYTESVNGSFIQLRFLAATVQNQGRYVCKLNNTESSEQKQVDSFFVYVDYRLSEVKNINCLVYDWSSMTCTLDLGRVYRNPHFIVVSLSWSTTVFREKHWTRSEFKAMKGKREVSYTWSASSFRADRTYSVQVRVDNRKTKLNSSSEIFNINTYYLVKPIKVKDLSARSENSTCVRLRWKDGSIESAAREKIFYITSATSSWNINDLHFEKEGRTDWGVEDKLLCGLQPNTNYTITIKTKPTYGGFFSENNSVQATTAQSVPGGAPIVTIGSFMATSCNKAINGSRTVTIYWKPVEKILRHGPIRSHRFIISEAHSGSQVEDVMTLGNTNQAILSKNLNCTLNYQIALSASTDVGYSNITSQLILKSYSSQPRPPTNFVVQANFDTTPYWVKLSWNPAASGAGSIDRYTLYYCQGSKRSKTCKAEWYNARGIDWVHVPSNQSEFTLYLPDDVWIDDYLFGISADAPNSSSGITWSQCTFVYHQVPQFAPTGLRVVRNDTGGLEIQWDPQNCLKEWAYVSSYKIHYRPVDGVEGGDTVRRQSIEVDGGHASCTLRDLLPGVTYAATVQAVSLGGEGPESGPLYFTRGQACNRT